MGRMKEIYMDLYYNMDGDIPPEYDLDGYMYKMAQELKNQQEYEYKKTQENCEPSGDSQKTPEKRSSE